MPATRTTRISRRPFPTNGLSGNDNSLVPYVPHAKRITATRVYLPKDWLRH
jgi:hypothetical protein